LGLILYVDLTYRRGDADACMGSFTRLLPAEQCWVICVAWWMSRSHRLQSSFTMSIHLFLGLPCFLVSYTSVDWSASFGWSIFLHITKKLQSPLLYAICYVLE